MKAPLPIGTPIDVNRYRRWTNLFGTYRATINRNVIEEWLAQFKPDDQDLAARLLDAVVYYDHTSIATGFRSVLSSLDGWHLNEKKRDGRWFFAAMSGSAGESGDLMLREFRRANGLQNKRYNNLFVNRSDLVRQVLTGNDKVVLVDDFSGSGDQVCEVWNDPSLAFGELLSTAGTVYLVLHAATETAREKISNETSLQLVTAQSLTDRDNLFSPNCPHFTAEEKERILHYCAIADKKNPRGYSGCGLLLAYNHGCPNNSLPILHVVKSKWNGIFPMQV